MLHPPDARNKNAPLAGEALSRSSSQRSTTRHSAIIGASASPAKHLLLSPYGTAMVFDIINALSTFVLLAQGGGL